MRPEKIAILRANALGDFVFALPALYLLRQYFPHAELVYLGKSMHQQLLANRPGPIDRVEVIPSYPGVGAPASLDPDPREVDAFFTRMQAEKFDLALQLHGGGRYSNPFVLRLGAAYTAGLGTPDAVQLDRTLPYVQYFNESLRYLEVVASLRKNEHQPPPFSATGKDIRDALEVLEHHPAQVPFVLLNPGASDPRRRWPAEKFACIADFLVHNGLEVYINGLAEEKILAERVLSYVQNTVHVHNLSGMVSLTALTGLVSLADLVLSNDSGPLHLAHILQTPAVGIYWAGNLITAMPLVSTRMRPLVSWTTACPVCGLSCRDFERIDNGCPHQVSFVSEVPTEEVQAAIGALLGTDMPSDSSLAENVSN